MRHIVGRLRNRTAAFTHDMFMIPCAWFGAYWLRFNLEPIPLPILEQAVRVLPLVMIVQGTVFWYFGLYRGVWRFASLPDLWRIMNAVVVGVALSAVTVFLVTRMVDVPRSVVPLFAMLLLILLGGPRLVYRWLKERGSGTSAASRVLIVGAGAAGELLVRDMLRDPIHTWEPVAFVDDASEKRGREIHGVRVIAKCARIPDVVREHRIDTVLLAVPSASARDMRRLVGLCTSAGVPLRTLPSRIDPGGHAPRAPLAQLRNVSIEDLLGRETVTLDWSAISRGVTGKVVLVTGGGGSIGSELVRQLARLGPKAVVILEHSEFNLYAIDHELRDNFPDLEIEPVLADVCDRVAVERCFTRHRPDVVFHAAAYKHVPMLEHQIREAAHNNILGTNNVAVAAGRHGCSTMVLISTDKAVNPTNVMGATKRVAELVCQNIDAHYPKTRFVTVRFGNVLDSAGSVVPLFRAQIAAGGPVTVTHPEVKRYFMTIPEASQLIMQAGAIGQGGEIFVLDMGDPIKIQYLAEQMIALSGRRGEVEIVHTGLRPGEKLFEELFHGDEQLSATVSDKILLARSRAVPWHLLERELDSLARACRDFDEPSLERQLGQLVPEYQPRPTRSGSNVVPLRAGARTEEKS